jgi:type I restriction enzyme S subunit
MTVVQGWAPVTVAECCEILDHKRIPVNAEEREQRIGDIPYYGANGLQGYIDDFLFDEPLILIAEDGGRFEEYASRPIAYRIAGKSWVNNHAHVLRAKDGYCQDAIFYSLEHKDIQSFIVGGTRSKLNQGALKAITFELPISTVEQTRIADILSTVDRAIQQTEALIAKQRRIKTGLMRDLLARGVDENGSLRSEGTHEFKHSPAGRIPAEWDPSTLEHVGEWHSGGTPSKANPAYWGDEIPWLCPKDMKAFDLATTEDKLTPVGVRNGSRLVPPYAVFIVVRGMILAHTFPVTISSVPMAFNQDVKAIVAAAHVEPRFLAYWFVANAHNILKITTTATHGTKRFDMNEVFDVPLGLPKREEQVEIVKRLDAVTAEIAGNLKAAAKLGSLKTGLMQSLLTGRKRVTGLVEVAAQAVEQVSS